MTRDERKVAAYLIAENAVLLEQLGPRRILYTDAQRRRLAIAARALGRKRLSWIDTLVTPDTLLRKSVCRRLSHSVETTCVTFSTNTSRINKRSETIKACKNVLLTPANDNHLVTAPVIRRKRLGGLLSYHHRRAA